MNIDWPSFLQGLTIEFISVVILGSVVALVLDYQRKKYEAHQAEQISREAKRRYLIYIKDEINANLMLMHGKSTEDQSRPATAMVFKTTYWDALVPSGLLPSLLEQGLLSGISDFYHALRVLTFHYSDIQSEIRAAPHETDKFSTYLTNRFLAEHVVEELKEKILPEAKSAIEQATKLVRRLEKEIESLER